MSPDEFRKLCGARRQRSVAGDEPRKYYWTEARAHLAGVKHAVAEAEAGRSWKPFDLSGPERIAEAKRRAGVPPRFAVDFCVGYDHGEALFTRKK